MRGLSEEQKRRLEQIRERQRAGYGSDGVTFSVAFGRARADVRWLMQEWAEDRKSLKNLLKMYYELLCAVVNETDVPAGHARWPIGDELWSKIVAALGMVGKAGLLRPTGYEGQAGSAQAPGADEVSS